MIGHQALLPVERRAAIARQIASIYAAEGRSEAGFIHGSVARGTADLYSDLELGCVWRTPPNEANLVPLAFAVNGSEYSLRYIAEKQAWVETYKVDGLKIDTCHFTCNDLDQIITDVVNNYDMDVEKQTTIAVLLSSIVLYGSDNMERWRNRAQVYPAELARRIIAERLRAISPHGIREKLAERNEIPLLYENYSGLTRQLLAIVMALNHTFHSSFKWTKHQINSWPVVPPNFFKRLESAYRLPPVEGNRVLRHLIMDIFLLIEAFYPSHELDVARERLEKPCLTWDVVA